MGILSFFSNLIDKKSVFDRIGQGASEFIYKIKLELWRMEKRMIKSLFMVSFLVMSFVALALSLIFFFIEYLNLTKTISFLIIGIVLLIIGIILKI